MSLEEEGNKEEYAKTGRYPTVGNECVCVFIIPLIWIIANNH